MKLLHLFIVALSLVLFVVDACTNILVSPEASIDGSSIVAYNADSGSLYGSLYHYPKGNHPEGAMRQVFDWDSGQYLGEIPEAKETYNVVGNSNKWGVIIGETTWGGLSILQGQKGALIDYGSLIWTTLQRSKTARQAIETMASLVAEFGYASGGESFSIADSKEVWVMEMIGKGNYEKGAVWVAQKLPKGAVCAHANQARIRTFALDDKETSLYAPDVISFARKLNLFSGNDNEFSFSDTYDPVTFNGARFCEARVWSFFSQIMGKDWSNSYADYASGQNITNRMPLFVTPPSKISATSVMGYMRNHYENTQLDMSGLQFSDVGATWNNPNRFHPLTWISNGKSYLNERPISTQQTGWNFVGQSRSWMPDPLKGLLWFGVDDSATTVRLPVYSCSTTIPTAFAGKGAQDGVTTPILEFDAKAAFWTFNMVANWAYTRWDLIYPEVLNAILAQETNFLEAVTAMDNKALELFSTAPASAVDAVTDFSMNLGAKLITDWHTLFGKLFTKYRDGYIITPNSEMKACGCSAGSQPYPQSWYDRIASDTGDHYLVPQQLQDEKEGNRKCVSKLDLLAKR